MEVLEAQKAGDREIAGDCPREDSRGLGVRVEGDVSETAEVLGNYSYGTQIGGNSPVTTAPRFRVLKIDVYGSTK